MNMMFTALCLLMSLNALSQKTYFVNDDATGANNGSSWPNAFTKLQDALKAAVSGDSIWVAAGTYYPDEGEGYTNNNRFYSFHLVKNGVAIYGGFAGTEVQLSERNFAANVTTLSGDIDQNNTLENNSYHVVQCQSSSVDNTTILDGFTITGGNADNAENFLDNLGGGMINSVSSPTINNCNFSGNRAEGIGGGSGLGGGMYNSSSSPTLTNCSFSGNTARADGGGNGYGGGIYNTNSSPILTNCSFSGNRAGVIVGVFGSGYGGGIYNESSSPILTNCNFSGNRAESIGEIFGISLGGGIYNNVSSPTLTNCSFSGNMAKGDGGAIGYGGGIYNTNSSSITLTNCILWGNTVEQIFNDESTPSSNPVVTYSIVQGGYIGTGNLDQDPLFVDAANGDLHLEVGSPAIDKGLNSANTTAVDLDGKPRIVNSTIDLGAYEFQDEGMIVSSFTLIDAEGDDDIRALKDGDTINLAALSSMLLNIRANTSPAAVGSVVFKLVGQQTYYHSENIAPYALFVNNKGDYLGEELKPGDYILTATPYNDIRGTGEKGTPLTIHFHVLYQVVNSFTLINADTDQDIRELKDGDEIDLSALPSGMKLNVRANTSPAMVGSVAFKLAGPVKLWHTENTAPYALLTNNGSDYTGFTPVVGNYTLSATPYSGAKASGQKGVEKSVGFSVVNSVQITWIDPKLRVMLDRNGTLLAAPNPARGQSTISFSVPQSGYTTLEMIDQSGAIIERLYAAQAYAGQVYTFSFSRKQLRSGVYVLRLTSGKYVQTYKLVWMP